MRQQNKTSVAAYNEAENRDAYPYIVGIFATEAVIEKLDADEKQSCTFEKWEQPTHRISVSREARE